MAAGGAVPLPLADVSASRAALRSRFRPGLRLLVSYEMDPGWHHERVLLSSVIDDDWVVLTPDDDVYSESLSDWKSVEVLTGLDAYPGSVVGGVVQFGEPLTDEELLRFVARARETAVQERALRPGSSPWSYLSGGLLCCSLMGWKCSRDPTARLACSCVTEGDGQGEGTSPCPGQD